MTAPARHIDHPEVRPPRSPTQGDAPASRPRVAEEKDTVEAIDNASEIQVGKQIAGKYRIDKVIGRGGMGVVLRATHRSLDEPVAIKVLRHSMMAMPEMVTRFTREARAASRIKSEHIARVTDVDTLESGVPYMVMEYLEGTDLAAMLREQGRPSMELAVRCIRQACDAIAEAHVNGIVHRDLKPANLFLARRSDGRELVKVLDFGISKIEGPGEQDPTRTGTMMGSPKFMAPEQMVSMHDVDGRADIWALGAILYNLLTGISPFAGESLPQVCSFVLYEEPVPPRVHRAEIPAELNAIVLRCLQKNPEQRFSTASELRAALAPFDPGASDAGLSDEAQKPPPSLREAPPSRSSGLSPISAPGSSSTSNAQPSAMVSSMDTLAFLPKRRSPRVILGALALMLAIGLGAMALSERHEPTAVDVTPTRDTRVSGVVPPRLEEPPAPAPALSSSVEVTPAQGPVEPATSGIRRRSVTKPGASTAGAKKTAATADPFGGSRN